jgi:hypothetical protein
LSQLCRAPDHSRNPLGLAKGVHAARSLRNVQNRGSIKLSARSYSFAGKINPLPVRDEFRVDAYEFYMVVVWDMVARGVAISFRAAQLGESREIGVTQPTVRKRTLVRQKKAPHRAGLS